MFEENRYYRTTRLVRKDTEPVDSSHGHQHLNDQLWSGRVLGSFRSLQPLHVGTGQYVPPQSVGIESDVPLLKSFHQVDGRLIVPGSSLKGPIRSLVEAMTHSCVSKSSARLDRDNYGECRYNSQRRRGEICIACKLFGAMGYQGQIHFADAPLIEGGSAIHYIPPQYQPKGSRERRHYPHDLQDRRDPTWPLEVATAGSRFAYHIRYENLSPAELGLLLIALGAGNPPLCLKIGAGKSSGLGAIHFQEVNAQKLILPDLYRSYSSEGAWQDVDAAECVQAAEQERSLLRQDALSRLQDDLDCSHFKEAP